MRLLLVNKGEGMYMKINDLVNVKTLIVTIIFFVGGGVALAGIFRLPKRIEVVEEKANKTEDNVQKLANELDKYIAVNEAQKASDKEQKKLMLDIVEKLAQKEKPKEITLPPKRKDNYNIGD